LHHALHLLVPADDRVKLGLTGLSGEVGAELVEHERTRGGALFAPTGRDGLLALVARQQLDDLLTNPSEVGAELDQHLSGYSLALADEAEQNVLGADVAVSQLQRLTEAERADVLRPRCEGNVSARCLLALSDELLDLVAHLFEGDVHALESLRCQAFTLVDQAEQNVLGADVVVFEKFRFFLCERSEEHTSELQSR